MSQAVGGQIADEVLVQEARAGSGDAFVSFATRWWPAIARVAWSMLGETSQAIAVTEEAIGIALASPRPAGTPLSCFMYRLTIWLAILRRRSRLSAVAPASPILAALDGLQHMDRAALVLRDVADCSIAEVAAILESSKADARERVHRARVRLAHVLGDALDREILELELPERRSA